MSAYYIIPIVPSFKGTYEKGLLQRTLFSSFVGIICVRVNIDLMGMNHENF